MPVRFQAMLEDFKEAEQAKAKQNPFAGFVDKLRQLWSFQPGMQLSYTIVLIVLGVGFGYFMKGPGGNDKAIQEITGEVREIKKTMMLALLENPSASERIKGVSYTQRNKKRKQKQGSD